MSITRITSHNENIFNMLTYQKDEVYKKLNYKSKFADRIDQHFRRSLDVETLKGKKVLCASDKSSHRTMGYAVTPIRRPCEFLRKGEGVQWRRLKEHVCPPEARKKNKPPLPVIAPAKPTVKPVVRKLENQNCPHPIYFRNHKHRYDFVKLNIEKMKNVKAKIPPPKYVDTPHGDTHNLLNSGLLPQNIFDHNYGKVPCYIEHRKKFLESARKKCLEHLNYEEQLCRDYLPSAKPEGIHPLLKEEREKILAGLKKNHEDLTNEYKAMPICINNIPQRLRRGKLESDLRQLEQDIFFLETTTNILIADV